MANSYAEELVYTESEDGIILEGAVIRPATQGSRSLAVVWTHGLTGKFYGTSAVRVGRHLAGAGYTFVTGNNRGHDFGTVLYRRTSDERIIGGGGWERFDESPYDVGAWVAFAEGLGFRRIALLGHSLGALKVVYYQAQRQDPRVAALIAASPPLRAGRRNPELLAQAERLVAEGRGMDLLPWGSSPAGAGTSSAQTYVNRMQVGVDVYGLDTPDPPVARITCPLLALYGTNEADVGTAADLDVIRRNATAAAQVDTLMIDGADHIYVGREEVVGTAIAEWLGRLF